MKKQGAEQNWWAALSGWLHKHQGRADFLYVYDREQRRLDRCFDRNVTLENVDAETIRRLHAAAAEGRLGLVRPGDLKPQLLTADPETLFVPDKAAPEKEEHAAVKTEQDSVEQEKKTEAEEKAPVAEEQTPSAAKQQEDPDADPAVSETEPRLNQERLERAAADPVIAQQLREAEAYFRQVVYIPPKPERTVSAEPSGSEIPAPQTKEQSAVQEAVMEMIRSAMPPQPEADAAQNQEQMVAALAQMVLAVGKPDARSAEQLERERLAREKLLTAQNLFIWAAASDRRDQKELEARIELLDASIQFEPQESTEQKRLTNVAKDLYGMTKKGASDKECKERILDYLDGKEPPKTDEEEAATEEAEEEISHFNEMWGNALRQFCRFAASQVPLSVRHVQVAEQCRKILQETKVLGLNMKQLGLDPQEQMAVRGTMELGTLVERGLLAQAALTSGQRLPQKQYRQCLCDYLAMKGVEETLVPHVEAHQKEISNGDGPVSSLQVLMANRGFRAKDFRAKVDKTDIVARLEKMGPAQVARMIRQNGREIAAMGRQVMVASYQMADGPEPVREPQAPQMNGPAR